ncbi:MAG: GNAT family N-acetyltransferase [Azoarcus sp.]|nr:GNAT family N-acetyltransferase [Azoarcus sp.]
MAFPEEGEAQGYRVLSAPLARYREVLSCYSDHITGGRQFYRRFFIDMSCGFNVYMDHFSAKTRSVLRRKRRKLSEYGKVEVLEYRTPVELEKFIEYAIPLSRKTYQARLLNSGLPEGQEAHAYMMNLAKEDRVRAFLLFIAGEPVSYLYLPIENEILYYAYLGYDPALAHLSPGTMLQIEALERLFYENRYRYFDFTEGEGAHKALFGTGSVEACSFFLLKPNFRNRILMRSLTAFDETISVIHWLAEKSNIYARLRKLLRK